MQKPLVGLTSENLVREATAGVTLLAIAIPLNIGYAQIAGLPPTAGLYALVLPGILYALVGLLAAAGGLAGCCRRRPGRVLGRRARRRRQRGLPDAGLAQAILCGVMFLGLSVFKLGFLANFLSKPILVGFVGGLALDILVSQVAKMLGVKIDSGGEFVEKLGDLVTGLDTINVWSVVISVSSVVVLVGGKRAGQGRPVGAGRARGGHRGRRAGRPGGRRGRGARRGRVRRADASPGR